MQTCLAIPKCKQTSKVHYRPWNTLATTTTEDCKSNAPFPLPSWVFSDWHLARATSTTYRMDGAKHSFVWTAFLSHSSVRSGYPNQISYQISSLVISCLYDCEGLAATPRPVCVVDLDFVLALKLPALQIARLLVALECTHGDAHCTSDIPVCRKRASTVGASELSTVHLPWRQ